MTQLPSAAGQVMAELQALLYTALSEPIGLLVQVSDFNRARSALYRARNEAKDPALAALQFRASPGLEGGNLIILKQVVQLGGAKRDG